MAEETNRTVHLAVIRTLLQSVHCPVKGVVNRDVYNALHWAMYWTVSWAVYQAANRAMYGVRQFDPKHPALQEFLYSCGTEVGTQ